MVSNAAEMSSDRITVVSRSHVKVSTSFVTSSNAVSVECPARCADWNSPIHSVFLSVETLAPKFTTASLTIDLACRMTLRKHRLAKNMSRADIHYLDTAKVRINHFAPTEPMKWCVLNAPECMWTSAAVIRCRCTKRDNIVSRSLRTTVPAITLSINNTNQISEVIENRYLLASTEISKMPSLHKRRPLSSLYINMARRIWQVWYVVYCLLQAWRNILTEERNHTTPPTVARSARHISTPLFIWTIWL